MEIYVEKAVVGQTQKGKPKTGLLAKGVWHNIFEARPDLEGRSVVIKQGKFQGWYDIDFVVDKTPPASKPEMSAANSHEATANGKISSLEWAAFMKFIGNVAKEIEPDTVGDNGVNPIDRSRARAAILNTCLISFKEGKIEFEMPPEESGGAPF